MWSITKIIELDWIKLITARVIIDVIDNKLIAIELKINGRRNENRWLIINDNFWWIKFSK